MSDDRIWKALAKKLAKDNSFVKVGVLSNKGGDADHGEGISMIELAAIHELGSPAAGIPARPWIRPALKPSSEMSRVMGKLAHAIVEDRKSHARALEELGTWAATQVKKYVKAGPHISPALKPATVAAKGSTRPLVDTGRMVNSVNHLVVKNGS